jgi:hypothetical protein
MRCHTRTRGQSSLPFPTPSINMNVCPGNAFAWSGGKVVYAGGVQFPPVQIGGRTFLPSKANNLHIFPRWHGHLRHEHEARDG